MATGYHTEASMPSVLISGFKNILAMSFGTGYTNERFAALLDASANAQANAQANVEAEAEEEEAEPEKPKV
jgi:hypothetical protein